MGKSVTPSCERHRGYRTHDRPPARGAPERMLNRRTSALGKYLETTAADALAIRQAAGIGHLQFGLVPEQSRLATNLRPSLLTADGRVGDAIRRRFVSGHSRLQCSSAGRNLITLFSRVNNLAQSFFRTRPHAQHPMRTTAPPRRPSSCTHTQRRLRRIALHASNCAGFSHASIFFMRTVMHVEASSSPSLPAAQGSTRCTSITRMISRCTSRFARTLRKISSPHAPLRALRCSAQRLKNEKPATLPPRVDCAQKNGCGFSARLLRAVRRNRRRRADR